MDWYSVCCYHLCYCCLLCSVHSSITKGVVMDTQLFAKLKDGRLVAVKSFDGQVVSIRVKPGCTLNIPLQLVKRFDCVVSWRE